MARWQRAYVCATCAVIGFALAYTLCDFGGWPRFYYFPYEGRFELMTATAGKVAISYWGTFLWGAGGGLVGAGLGAAATLVWKKPLPRVALGLLAAWSLTAFFLAGAYYTWNLWPF